MHPDSGRPDGAPEGAITVHVSDSPGTARFDTRIRSAGSWRGADLEHRIDVAIRPWLELRTLSRLSCAGDRDANARPPSCVAHNWSPNTQPSLALAKRRSNDCGGPRRQWVAVRGRRQGGAGTAGTSCLRSTVCRIAGGHAMNCTLDTQHPEVGLADGVRCRGWNDGGRGGVGDGWEVRAWAARIGELWLLRSERRTLGAHAASPRAAMVAMIAISSRPAMRQPPTARREAHARALMERRAYTAVTSRAQPEG